MEFKFTVNLEPAASSNPPPCAASNALRGMRAEETIEACMPTAPRAGHAEGASSSASASNPSSRASSATHAIGALMPDGTIHAGISPNTGKAMYATPTDAPLTMKFNKAQKYAANLNAYGHQDWRVPTKAELSVLFHNRAAIGGFNLTGSGPVGRYWSSSPYPLWLNAWGQVFNGPSQHCWNTFFRTAVRCVR